MKNFLNKKIGIKTFICTISLTVISLTVACAVIFSSMDTKMDKYKQEISIKDKRYVDVIDSINVRYNTLYGRIDSLYELNWENVKFWAEYYGINNKEVLLSQVKIESGNLQSNLCVNHGNLVGMYFPRIRETTASGWVIADGGNKVAIYDNWWESLEDYKLWQEYFGYNKDYHITDYLTVLDNHGNNGYAIANGYTDKVRANICIN